jgi:hypothetical protein
MYRTWKRGKVERKIRKYQNKEEMQKEREEEERVRRCNNSGSNNREEQRNKGHRNVNSDKHNNI